jgi:hypothetical protein
MLRKKSKTEKLTITIDDFKPVDDATGLLTCTLQFRGDVQQVQTRVEFEAIADGNPRNGRAFAYGCWVTVTGAGAMSNHIATALQTWYLRQLALTPATGEITTAEALEVLAKYEIDASSLLTT